LLRRAAQALAAAAFATVAAGFLGPLHEGFDAVASFRLHGVGLGAGALLLATAVGAWGAAVPAAGALGLGLATLGPVWQPLPPPGDGPALTLFVGNLSARNDRPAALWQRVLTVEADVLVAVETTRAVFDAAPSALAARYPHRILHDGPEALRVAILSRWPLSDARLHLDNTVAPTGAQAVVTLPGGAQLGLVGVHLSRPVEGLQMAQARALGPIAVRLGRPLIVAGDFNAESWTHAVRLAAESSGTRPLGGWRRTWVGTYPTPIGEIPAPVGHQIDHLLVSPGIGVAILGTVGLPGSDHRGLVARLTLPRS